jgi:3',5'-cyclic AMP phosphodiesterase CpdA
MKDHSSQAKRTSFRIAHLSDLHLLGEREVPFRRFLNKRITGFANLRFKRKRAHQLEIAQALAHQVKNHEIDHVVITGDVSNLALETEFERVSKFIEDDLDLSPSQVSLIPGNHDVYTRGSAEEQRFYRYFSKYMSCDLAQASGQAPQEQPAGLFPYVQFRGPVAIIGLSTAVPRVPLMAAGRLGSSQLSALRTILEHPEVRSRLPIVLQHHPPQNKPNPVNAFLEGLHDVEEQRSILGTLKDAVVLHGHLHKRIHRFLPSDLGGIIHAIGATSTSLEHSDPDRMAGINLYEIDETGQFQTPEALVFQPKEQSFKQVSIPKS